MNKDDYIKSVNEIKASEELKRKTLNKIKGEKKNFRIQYKLINAVAIVLVVFSILWLSQENKIDPHKNVFLNEEAIPKVENYEKLVEILSKKEKENFYLDSDMRNSWTASEESKVSQDVSETNTQVANVDEADIVKTDGEYIYYIVQNNLIIVKAKNLEIVKEINFKSDSSNKTINVREMFLYDNKLVVISNKMDGTGSNFTSEYKSMCYDVTFIGKTYTVATVYDITDKTDVKIVREVEVEGNYLSARMIEDNVYLAANKYLYLYNTKWEEMNEDEIRPYFKDTATSTDYKCINYKDMYYSPESEETNYLNIVGFSVKNNRDANVRTILGSGDDIYMSEENLYVANCVYDFNNKASKDKTKIYKFELNRTNIKCVATGEVDGTIINQFAMDEKDGYFRIATTLNSAITQNKYNNVYVLNNELKTVGKLENLAKGERIYSVRFMGNRVYMVTFKQVDPLFVIDLANPTNPKVLGELKIPGFSEYLHPYDETHIIGFGKDTKETSTGATITGMKMALFDVSNPNEPKQMYTIKVGDKYSYSELSYNHKAFLFSKEKNIIAFPISKNESYNMYFRGAVVYGLTLDKGFELRGEIENDPANVNYTNNVDRIIYIGNTLYTVSSQLIKAVDMSTMEEIDRLEINMKDESLYILE